MAVLIVLNALAVGITAVMFCTYYPTLWSLPFLINFWLNGNVGVEVGRRYLDGTYG